MSLMRVNYGGAAPDVNLPANIFITNLVSGLCYSGLRIGADGDLYERHPTGGWSRYGTWLFRGSAATYYVVRSVDSGVLTTDAGAGPLQLNANRDYDVQTSSGESDAVIQFDIADEATGTNIVTSIIYTFIAISGNN